MYLQVLDFLFTLVHLCIVVFLISGWMWKPFRTMHLYIVVATTFCWTILGFWYGFGYCPLTDWQWQIKTTLGEQHLPNSFIKYIVDKVSGMNISASLIDLMTAIGFAMVIVVSVRLYFLRHRELKA